MYRRRKSISPIKTGPEPALKELLKNLEEEQIENLRIAIASRGEHRTSCILHKQDNCDADLVESARVLAIRAFRWENIKHQQPLIQLPWCYCLNCINPFHFALDYRLSYNEEDQDDSSPHESSTRLPPLPSPITPFEVSDFLPQDPRGDTTQWGLCMFWEEKTRVGPPVTLESRYFNLFANSMDENGLCGEFPSGSRQLSTREKISGGLTLWKSLQYIWIYNRDNDCAIFVHSSHFGEGPLKVCSGACIPVPIAARCLTISLIKGWGRKYRRQEVTECPAWLEIIIDP
ncbi:Oidioi.mRNA.OKI2018_I69.XSR.g16455.t1.cds [Oikopleura dioica]|uniref:Oidioi.mRNA.OKI2018_I69.XSR.g16455.t1.cds n=1 Tax=Oikopleura dioica TaxID=34765 RepID=A0ABN7SQI5_OIKDI|nr:Oidioi.mRNA.OKI2018_I69.XSR.g16455.t1.cds [Oikopleura dioica]